MALKSVVKGIIEELLCYNVVSLVNTVSPSSVYTIVSVSLSLVVVSGSFFAF